MEQTKFKIEDEVIILSNAIYTNRNYIGLVGIIKRIVNKTNRGLIALDIYIVAEDLSLFFYENEIILATKASKVLFGENRLD